MISRRSALRFLGLALLMLSCVAAMLWLGRADKRRGDRVAVAPKTGIVVAAINSHQTLPALMPDGQARALPADPSLDQALSLTSGLSLASRLGTIHGLQGTVLTTAQIDFMRAFVADPRLPQGLTIQQVRALKNDVLNVLCVQPGGEAATAAMLRALYADETQDAGLRDYALQHLVGLAERDSRIGWSTHWLALDGKNTDFAATALINLALHHRKAGLAPGELSHLEDAALRIASDPASKDPARSTALQVCGQLKLPAARPLACEIARSDKASFPFRIAAVATIGDLGGDADARDYLAALTTGPEKRLRIPAQSALKRFFIIN